MNLGVVLMTVHILGGGEPDVTIITREKSDHSTCRETAASLESDGPTLVDPVTERPVIMSFHKCVPLVAEDEIEEWQRFIATNS